MIMSVHISLASHPCVEDIPPNSLTHAKYKIRREHTVSDSLQPTSYGMLLHLKFEEKQNCPSHCYSLQFFRIIFSDAGSRRRSGSPTCYRKCKCNEGSPWYDKEGRRRMEMVIHTMFGQTRLWQRRNLQLCRLLTSLKTWHCGKIISSTKVIVTVTDLVKNLEGLTDRVKEVDLQLLNNLATNCPDWHKPRRLSRQKFSHMLIHYCDLS